MRTAFLETLEALAAEDSRICLVVGDLGFSVVEPFAKRFPKQFLNAGVAEQNMTGVAVGMALSGKIVFTYSIANFPTLRCLEQIRNDACYHRANLKIVSVGGGYAYGSLGSSHHATEDIAVLRALPEMVVTAPGDPFEVAQITRRMIEHEGPCYLRLGKANEPSVHEGPVELTLGSALMLRDGGDLTLIATGGMLPTARDAAVALERHGLSARVLSMHTVKPLDCEAILRAAADTGAILTLEEHSEIGGLGGAVAEVLAREASKSTAFRILGLPDRFCREVGGQTFLREAAGLTIEGVVTAALDLVRGGRDGDRKEGAGSVEIRAPKTPRAAANPTALQRTPATFRVPFVNPREHYRRIKGELDRAILGCLETGDLIHRRQLFDFERHLAEYVGSKYAVGVASGYHALFFALLGSGVGEGDEVITVAHTFAASVSAIVHTGAEPVLIDVGPDYNMDVGLIERAITPRTRAIMPVHLNGRVCDMDPIISIASDHGLAIVEDACQALGATYRGRMAGSFSAGCFSFYPFKALGGYGDGGALVTDDDEVARMATLMRYNGEDRQTGDFHFHGYTALLDNVQAAALDVKLRHFPSWVEHRREIAESYREGLRDIPEVLLPHFEGEGFRDSFQNYVIRARRRDELFTHLRERGVETLISWPKPMWSHAGLKLGSPRLPFTEQICREVISLPMSAETTTDQVEIVVAEIRDFYRP